MNDSLLNCLLDYKLRHTSMPATIWHWLKNRRKYSILNFDDIRREIKKSDTIFILGSGTTINEISEAQWKHVAKHDSAAINWWPLHPFVPTYYYSEYPHKTEHFNYYKKMLSGNISANYLHTIFFLSLNRAARRGIHPRVTPELFPENPAICFYQYHQPLRFNDISDLDSSSFERTVFYRGSLTAVLDLMNRIGYEKIVLLGVDLKKHIYFYDNYPEIRKMLDAGCGRPLKERENNKHVTTFCEPRKIAIQDYLYLLNDLYYKPNNTKLFCGSPKSLLAEKLPLYQF